MQNVTAESVLGTIIGHLNVEKAKLIVENQRLAVQAALVPKLTAENEGLKKELAAAKAQAVKHVEPPVPVPSNGAEVGHAVTAEAEAW